MFLYRHWKLTESTQETELDLQCQFTEQLIRNAVIWSRFCNKMAYDTLVLFDKESNSD